MKVLAVPAKKSMRKKRVSPIIQDMSESLTSKMKEITDHQRAFKRFRVNFTVLVHTAASEEIVGMTDKVGKAPTQITAVVTNASLSGLCFQCAVEYPLNDIVTVQITLGAHAYSLAAIVQRSQILERPGYRVFESGVQFLKSDENAQFIPILAKYLALRGR